MYYRAVRVENLTADLTGLQRSQTEVPRADGAGVGHDVVLRKPEGRHGRRRDQAGGQRVTRKVLHFVLFGQKNLPLQQIDRHIHFWEGKIGAPFFGKGRAGVQKDKGDDVSSRGMEAGTQQWNASAVGHLRGLDLNTGYVCGSDAGVGVQKDKGDDVSSRGMEAGTQQWNASAVGTLRGLHFFTGYVGGNDAGVGRKVHFEKRLGLILEVEFYFSERFALHRDQRGNNGAFGDRCEHTTVRKTPPLKRERGRFTRLAVITKGRLERKARERTQKWIYFLDVHALQAAGFFCGEFHGAGAFNKRFAGFALSLVEGYEWRIGSGVGDRFFQ